MMVPMPTLNWCGQEIIWRRRYILKGGCSDWKSRVDVSEIALAEQFSRFGKIENITVYYAHSYAFIIFRKEEDTFSVQNWHPIWRSIPVAVRPHFSEGLSAIDPQIFQEMEFYRKEGRDPKKETYTCDVSRSFWVSCIQALYIIHQKGTMLGAYLRKLFLRYSEP